MLSQDTFQIKSFQVIFIGILSHNIVQQYSEQFVIFTLTLPHFYFDFAM